MKNIRCKQHPKAQMLLARRFNNGGHLFICARCSCLITVHKGKITNINFRQGTGQITVRNGWKTKSYLFALNDARGFKAHRGMQVQFESGITSTKTEDYVHAATNIQPI